MGAAWTFFAAFSGTAALQVIVFRYVSELSSWRDLLVRRKDIEFILRFVLGAVRDQVLVVRSLFG